MDNIHSGKIKGRTIKVGKVKIIKVGEAEFIGIPAGRFQMGSNDGDRDEVPVHHVNISAFNMVTTEVTQGQWQAIMGSNPSDFSV
jgi:formylglycine-generating enzyme required for sulfatase activity